MLLVRVLTRTSMVLDYTISIFNLIICFRDCFFVEFKI
jgi:hypothetical protein